MPEIIDNTAKNNTRRDAMLRMYTKFALIFAYDANGVLVFTPTTRTLFSKGIDDNSGTYETVGYSTAVGGTNDIEITNAGKGGSFNNQYDTLLLSMGVFPERAPRVGIDASGAAVGTFLTTTVPRNGGVIGSREQLVMDQLVSGALGGAQLSLLPTNTNEGCTTYLGLPQLLPAGIGWVNSDLASVGFQAPSARYTFATPVLVAANRNNNDTTPNRIQMEWKSSITASERAMGAAARTSGIVVVIDMIAVCDVARVNVQRDATGNVTQIQPVDEIDSAKIACFSEKV